MNEVDTGRDRATEKGLGRLVGGPKLSPYAHAAPRQPKQLPDYTLTFNVILGWVLSTFLDLNLPLFPKN